MHFLAILEKQQRWHALHREAVDRQGVFVGIKLDHAQQAPVFLRQRLDDRRQQRHGPHQGAQKSTRTGSADFKTVASKSASAVFAMCMLTVFALPLLVTHDPERGHHDQAYALKRALSQEGKHEFRAIGAHEIAASASSSAA